jgi:hypothetical protein
MKHPLSIKKVTVKDLAKELRVSRGTIDRAFHDREGINPETKKLILEKAKELGYRTNRLAQTLSRKKAIKIGCVIPRGHGPLHDKGFFPTSKPGSSLHTTTSWTTIFISGERKPISSEWIPGLRSTA